jgi:DNA polymerase-3 subunit epsilon
MYAVIDIETTGGNYRWGRITEIAIYIHDGTRVTDEFSSLINPGMPIPHFITQLTGISDEMVQDAPTFSAVADTVASLTEGCIFVAHNSQFDYNFIRHEFQKLGRPYERPTLCTVRLSRKVIPNLASYSLGRLCEQLGIGLDNRHRAGGDAAATVKLLELLFERDTESQLNASISWQQPSSEYNKYLQNTRIEDLPQSAGLIYLYGADDELLYIDSARNIRKRVISLLKNKGGRSAFNIRQHLKDVAFEETGTYLIAQLRAHEEIVKNKPSRNIQPASPSRPKRWYILPDLQLDGYFHLLLERQESNGRMLSFRTKKEALTALEELCSSFELCPAYTALAQRPAACADKQKDSCKGACQSLEPADSYNKRVNAALQSLEESNNQLIVEKGRNPTEKALIKIENSHFVSWGYLNLQDNNYNLPNLLEVATTACRTPEATEIAQKYLLKNNVQQIISY